VEFEPGESQQAAAQAAAETLARCCGDAAWQAMAKAGLIALTLPRWLGGEALSVLEAAAVLTEVGRKAADVPALATIMPGVLPVSRWGHRELQERVLDGVGAGDVLLTAAVREPSAGLTPRPATVAALAGGQATVSGLKIGVPYAGQARWLVVPASLTSGGTAVAVVDSGAAGLTVTSTPTASGAPEATVRLDAAPVCGLLGAGGAAVAGLYRLALAGACALADGLVAGALALTTAHVATRRQFGRPLAAFQAVSQQIADVYITSRTLHLAALSGCWRLATGRDPDHDLDVAGYWLGRDAVAAMRTCHHLHGGTGLDASYPLHRYSAQLADLARLTGGGEGRLDALGARAGC
jgi:3-oxo-4-pregnene-20-carboxyl-CoA dehydrogenase alpha subunit